MTSNWTSSLRVLWTSGQDCNSVISLLSSKSLMELPLSLTRRTFMLSLSQPVILFFRKLRVWLTLQAEAS